MTARELPHDYFVFQAQPDIEMGYGTWFAGHIYRDAIHWEPTEVNVIRYGEDDPGNVGELWNYQTRDEAVDAAWAHYSEHYATHEGAGRDVRE